MSRARRQLKNALVFIVSLVTVQAAQAGGREAEIKLSSATGTVHGTLTLPAKPGTLPMVLLIAGSGPTDRDGNGPGMKNDSLLGLAHALAENGIASVRYDKRGIGKSASAGAVEADLRFDQYVSDATAWISLLRRDARFRKVVIVGHSEGSLIGMLASVAAKADGFVSLAGPGVPASQSLRKQLKGKLPPQLDVENDRILSLLESGQTSDRVPDALASLYRPSVQPYLISWFKHDPAAVFKQVSARKMIVQGSTDLQVSVDDAEQLHRAAPASTLKIIPGMNHVLKMVEGDAAAQMASYTSSALPVSPELVAQLSKFVHAE